MILSQKELKSKQKKDGFFDFLANLFQKKIGKVSLVIPAYNEEKTIGYVISQAKKVVQITEILVIDDGSKDLTSKIAKSKGAIVIRHHKNLGKGEAIKTGIAHAKEDIVLFLDADLKNIDEKKIKSLILPILKGKADFTKSSFKRSRGRVTEFAVKPMMKILYPDTSFKQPISGQFAGKKTFLRSIKIEPRWGIDISILLDAIKQGQRVLEVDIGELIHKKSSDEEVAKMSQEVMETMLKKSGLLYSKHKVAFFSDRVFKKSSNRAQMFLEKMSKHRITSILITQKTISREFATYFTQIKRISSGSSPENILEVAKKIAKKEKFTLKEAILVANKPLFELLAKEVDISFCFPKSPYLLKEKSQVIENPAEVLFFLE